MQQCAERHRTDSEAFLCKRRCGYRGRQPVNPQFRSQLIFQIFTPQHQHRRADIMVDTVDAQRANAVVEHALLDFMAERIQRRDHGIGGERFFRARIVDVRFQPVKQGVLLCGRVYVSSK